MYSYTKDEMNEFINNNIINKPYDEVVEVAKQHE